jgi:hypothetical protein
VPEGEAGPSNKPPLQLSESERNAVREAVSQEKTYQKTPTGFAAEGGADVPRSIAPMPLPRPLVYDVRVLQQYDYAKLDKNVIVIDPMNMKVGDVIERKWPASGEKLLDPITWAATRGRVLIGLAPEAPQETTGAALSTQ